MCINNNHLIEQWPPPLRETKITKYQEIMKYQYSLSKIINSVWLSNKKFKFKLIVSTNNFEGKDSSSLVKPFSLHIITDHVLKRFANIQELPQLLNVNLMFRKYQSTIFNLMEIRIQSAILILRQLIVSWFKILIDTMIGH